MQSGRWLLPSGKGRVLVLFISIVLIGLSQALIMTHVMRFLNRSGFILFMGIVLVSFHSY